MKGKRTNRLAAKDSKGRIFDVRAWRRGLRRELPFVLLGGGALAGVALGAWLSGHAAGFSQTWDALLARELAFLAQGPRWAVFPASLAAAFLLAAVCFLGGFSAWGMVLLPVLPFFRGLGLGAAGGGLFLRYGGAGFLFYACVMAPGAFVALCALLLAAAEGCRLSWRVLRLCRRAGAGETQPLELRRYGSRFGVVLLLCAAAAGLDTLLAVCVAGQFSF